LIIHLGESAWMCKLLSANLGKLSLSWNLFRKTQTGWQDFTSPNPFI